MGKLKRKADTQGAWIASSPSLVRFSSGCKLLDCALGGGWVLGRMSNIIGDKSTAKTGLAIEAMANFALAFPGEDIFYREAESAFDKDYAVAKMGMPTSARLWRDDHDRDLDTVEDVFEDLDVILKGRTRPALYLVDSLDALSDREEQKNPIGKGDYGTKAKRVGQLFRRKVRDIEASQVCVIIVSQVRANIGVTFGEKLTRTGGKAMDFYASHCVWLSNLGQVKKTINKQEKTIGIKVLAYVKKNKVGLPFRKAQFEYHFHWGMRDIEASLDWLEANNLTDEALGMKATAFYRHVTALPRDEYNAAVKDVSLIVGDLWEQVEKEFLPERTKY